MGACTPAVRFVEKHVTYQEAWDKCDNAHWMLWFLVFYSEKSRAAATDLALDFAAHTFPDIVRDERAEALSALRETGCATTVQQDFEQVAEVALCALYGLYGDELREERKWQCARIRERFPICPLTEENGN